MIYILTTEQCNKYEFGNLFTNKKNIFRPKPAVKLESVISPLQRRRRRRRERNLSHSESVLVAGEHVEVGPGLARVAVARLARQRHHSETGGKKGQRQKVERGRGREIPEHY